jgi:hypothetical protein
MEYLKLLVDLAKAVAWPSAVFALGTGYAGCARRQPTEREMAGVTIFPIVGWETNTTPAGYGVLTITVYPVRLEAAAQADPEKTMQVHHFGIAAEQCELLAQDLTRTAATLRERRKTAN